jgi:hypothetical protein
VAVLLSLPNQGIIDGFKGTIDFYVHDGTPCARRWPRRPSGRRSPLVQDQYAAFAYASRLWNLLSPEVQLTYIEMARGTRLSGRDMAAKAYLSGTLQYQFLP